MHWLLTSHVRRYHRLRGSSGRVWQGRFKAFPIQTDEHYFTVLRYVERNPVRAGLVVRAQDWRWSSLHRSSTELGLLDVGPLARPKGWAVHVTKPLRLSEIENVRQCVRRDAPFGDPNWIERTAKQLGLEASVRPLGRPRQHVSGMS